MYVTVRVVHLWSVCVLSLLVCALFVFYLESGGRVMRPVYSLRDCTHEMRCKRLVWCAASVHWFRYLQFWLSSSHYIKTDYSAATSSSSSSGCLMDDAVPLLNIKPKYNTSTSLCCGQKELSFRTHLHFFLVFSLFFCFR